MDRGVLHRRAPCRLDLAHAVVEVVRIRTPEVDHLVRLEDLPLLDRRTVQIALDEDLFAGNDLHVLRRHRPELDRTAEPLVDDRMQVGVSRELPIEDAEDGRIEAVLIRVDLREQLEERMRVRDLLVVAPVLGDLADDGARRMLRRVACEVRLRPAIRSSRVPELRPGAPVPHVEPERLRCDRDRVDRRGRVDPGRVVADGYGIRERLSLGVAASLDDRHRRPEPSFRRESRLDPCE